MLGNVPDASKHASSSFSGFHSGLADASEYNLTSLHIIASSAFYG